MELFSIFQSIQWIIYIIALVIIYAIYNLFKETFASKIDRHNIFKSIFIIVLFFSSTLVFIPNVNSEKLEDFYADSKSFELLDINHQFMIHNNTSENYNLILFDNCTELDSCESGNPQENRPHKTIKFDSYTNYMQLLLISKLMYNYSYDAEFKIHYYYIGEENERTTKTNLVYQNYMSSSIVSNISKQYYYINDESYNFSTLHSQTSAQRMSNIGIQHSALPLSYYNSFDKKITANSDISNCNIRNVQVKKEISLINYKWSYLTIKSEQLIQGVSSYNSYKFIDLLIERANYTHTLIIDSINIKLMKCEDNIFKIPFYEYYEFNNISSLRDRTIFNLDFVSNNYQQLSVSNMSLRILNNRISIVYENNNIYNSNILILHSGFTGYQITVSLTSDNFVNVYLYIKYSHNAKINNGDLFYNWSYQKIEIRNKEFAYISKLSYYDILDETYLSTSYIRNAMKYDVIDREITKIDYMENTQDIVMIKDYDSGGLRIPSIEDIKRVITGALKPLFNVLEGIKKDIIKPIQELIGKLDLINTAITNLQNLLTSLSGTITTEFGKMTDTLTIQLNNLGIDITSSVDFVTTAIEELKLVVGAVTTAVGEVKTIAEAVITTLDVLITNVETIYDAIIGEGGIIELINNMINIVSDFFNSIIELVNYLVTFLADWVGIAIDYTQIGFDYITEVFPIIPEIIGLSFSLMGFIFMYGLISRMLIYRDSQDSQDFIEILTYFQSIISWVYSLLTNIMNWITNMIP